MIKYLLTSIVSLCIFSLGYYIQSSNECLSSLNRIRFSVYISRGAGLVLSVFPWLLLIPVCKHLLTFIRQYSPSLRKVIPSHSLIMHKIFGGIVVIYGMVHTVSHYVNFYVAENLGITTMRDIHYSSYAGITGHIMILSMLCLLMFSGSYFKEKNYELFFYTHHFYIPVFAVFIFHSFGCFVKTNDGRCSPYYSVYPFCFFLCVFAAERLYRQFRKTTKVTHVEFFEDCVKIRFDKVFNYESGYYISIKCNEVSKFQYHPFTITSYPETDDFIEIYIKDLGDWTHKFRKILKNNPNPVLSLDGPYASPCDKIEDYDGVIFISTGIGITPFISLLKKCACLYARKELEIKKIQLVWVIRHNENFDLFREEMSIISKIIPQRFLDIQIFLTETFEWEEIKIMSNPINRHINTWEGTNVPINYGRPDLNKIIKKFSGVNYIRKVGVFTCSTRVVNNITKDICERLDCKDTRFHYVEESF